MHILFFGSRWRGAAGPANPGAGRGPSNLLPRAWAAHDTQQSNHTKPEREANAPRQAAPRKYPRKHRPRPRARSKYTQRQWLVWWPPGFHTMTPANPNAHFGWFMASGTFQKRQGAAEAGPGTRSRTSKDLQDLQDLEELQDVQGPAGPPGPPGPAGTPGRLNDLQDQQVRRRSSNKSRRSGARSSARSSKRSTQRQQQQGAAARAASARAATSS